MPTADAYASGPAGSAEQCRNGVNGMQECGERYSWGWRRRGGFRIEKIKGGAIAYMILIPFPMAY
jgi:hypothetical protein